MKTFHRFAFASLLPLLIFGCDLSICGVPGAMECRAGQFCKVSTGLCDDPAAFKICTPMPEFCTTQFDPVCGCDSQTYANACLADAAGVSIEHLGPCVEPCCDPDVEPGVGANPTCFEGATCCSDGQWQCNQGDGSTTCDEVGDECGQVCGGISGLPCDQGQFCKLNTGECCCDFQGVCIAIPDACIEVFQPVCGCDGRTYSNECFAWASSVNVATDGPCN